MRVICLGKQYARVIFFQSLDFSTPDVNLNANNYPETTWFQRQNPEFAKAYFLFQAFNYSTWYRDNQFTSILYLMFLKYPNKAHANDQYVAAST